MADLTSQQKSINDQITSTSLNLQQSQSYALDYQLHYKIETGGQATLYYATKNQEEFALKIYSCNPKDERAYKNQVDLLGGFSWKGLLSLMASHSNATFKLGEQQQKRVNIIVMPFMERGDVLNWIHKKGPLTENTGRYFAKKLMATFLYLNSKYILHRDVKPQNILLDDNYQPVLIDFGFVVDSRVKQTDFVGDARLAAPEVIKHVEYTSHSQMYSLGILLFFILTGEFPFGIAKISDVSYRLLFQGKIEYFWTKIEKKINVILSKNAKDLIIAMIHPKNIRRITFEEINNMEWLKQDKMTQNQYVCEMKQMKQKKYL